MLPRRRTRHVLIRTAACLALSGLMACAGVNKKPTRPDLSNWPEIKPDFRVESLRARLFEYSTTFAANVDLTASSIERRATDADVRRNALVWRLRAVPEMRKACYRPGPVGGLIDAWTLARQMDQLFTKGAASDAFGTFQPEVIAVSDRLLEQMQDIGGSIAVSPAAGAQFEQKVIDPWVSTHPVRDLTFVRESPLARFADQAQASDDVFQSVGTMEDLMLGLSQQARIYLADMPRNVRGEVDLLRDEILPADTLASMQNDLRSSVDAASRIAAVADGVTGLVNDERRELLDGVDKQRALVMEGVSVERERAVDGITRLLAAERTVMLKDINAQRLATYDWADAERRAAIADVHQEMTGAVAALQSERAAFVADMRHIVDMTLLRVALFVLAGLVLAPFVAHIYVRVWPRRR